MTVPDLQGGARGTDILGYDPRPDVRTWHKTPIPPPKNPLPATKRLKSIAEYMWWNGPPWTILRNRHEFLTHAMDWADPDDFLFLWNTVPRADWIAMLKTRKPGQVSTRSYCLCMSMAGCLSPRDSLDEEWLEDRHVKDLLFANRRTARELHELDREVSSK